MKNDWRDLLLALYLVIAILLVAVLVPFRTSHYVLLRFTVCTICAYSAFLSYKISARNWVWIMGALAVLFNPLFPVRLERPVWMDVYLGSIVVVAVAIWSAYRRGAQLSLLKVSLSQQASNQFFRRIQKFQPESAELLQPVSKRTKLMGLGYLVRNAVKYLKCSLGFSVGALLAPAEFSPTSRGVVGCALGGLEFAVKKVGWAFVAMFFALGFFEKSPFAQKTSGELIEFVFIASLWSLPLWFIFLASTHWYVHYILKMDMTELEARHPKTHMAMSYSGVVLTLIFLCVLAPIAALIDAFRLVATVK